MNLVNCKASKPSNEPKKKKKGGGRCLFTLVCNAFRQNCTHTFSDAEQTPTAHWTITCLPNPHYSSAKKKGGGIISKGTNQLLPCLQQLTNLCLSNKSESSSSVQKTSGTAHIKSGPCGSRVDSTILLLWGPASNAPPTCLQLVFPDSPLHSRNRDRFLLSHWAQSLDKVLSSCLPSSLSFKYLKKIVFF